jgi:hypothetical protein
MYEYSTVISSERDVALSMVSPFYVSENFTAVLGSIPASSDAVGDLRFGT